MPSQPSSANCAQFSGSQPRLGRGDLAAVLERVLVANEALGAVLQLLLFVGKGQIHLFLRNPLQAFIARATSLRNDVLLNLGAAAVDAGLAHVEIARRGGRRMVGADRRLVGVRGTACRAGRAAAYSPTASMASSAMRCWISEPRIFRVETSGPGAPPRAMAESARSSLISSAWTCRSRSAICAVKAGSSARLPPFAGSLRAMSRRLRTPRLEAGTSAMPSRSLASRNLAQVQPSFSLPMRFSTGTRTLSRNTSFT